MVTQISIIKGGLAHSFNIFQVCSHAQPVNQWENLINHMGLIESLSSSCSPSAWEERPWKGMIICFSENWKHEGGVLFNGEICWVQLCWIQGIVLWPPLPVMFNSTPQPAISNGIYSNINLKIKQVSFSAFVWMWDMVSEREKAEHVLT